MILRDEDGVEWDCTKMNGDSDAAIAVRDGKVFHTLWCRQANDPAAMPHEIIVATELDLNNPIVQREVLRRARRRD